MKIYYLKENLILIINIYHYVKIIVYIMDMIIIQKKYHVNAKQKLNFLYFLKY